MSVNDDIEGRLGDISGRLGDISGGTFEAVQRIVLDGRLIDELSFLAAKIRRLEKDLMGITESFDNRVTALEGRFREPSGNPPAPPSPHN